MVYRYYVTLPWWRNGFDSRYPLQSILKNGRRTGMDRVNTRRGSQVVRQGSAKPSYAGSILAHASNFTLNHYMVPLQIIHVIVTILLSACVLLQQRGSGLGDAFGADSAVYTSRRGAEKVLYYLTMVFGVTFIVLAVLQLYLARS